MKKFPLWSFALCFGLVTPLYLRPACAQTITGAQFELFEREAPKSYPTTFVVINASQVPGNAFQIGNCSMYIETIGVGYQLSTQGGFRACQPFAPGTVLYGRVRRGPLGDAFIDLINTDAAADRKPHHERYFVSSTDLFDANKQ